MRKCLTRLGMVLTLLLCLGMAGIANAAPPAAQLGVVDYLYLIDQHPDTAKANEELRIEQEQAKKEYDAKAANLDEKARQELDRELGLRVEQKRQTLLKAISESVNSALKNVAEAKGMIAVVHKNAVALGGVDITDDVLKKLTAK